MRKILSLLLISCCFSSFAYADEADDLAKALNGDNAPVAAPAPHGTTHTGDFQDAKRAFEALDISARFTIQLCLTALGDMNSVPNEQLSTRTYTAIKTFQESENLPSDGIITNEVQKRIIDKSTPLFKKWRFRPFDVTKNIAIWVPFGPDFQADREDPGYSFAYPNDDKKYIMNLRLMSFSNTNLHRLFQTMVATYRHDGSTIGYSVETPEFFAINVDSFEKGNKITRYMRFQRDHSNNGIAGFILAYEPDEDPYMGARLSVLIGDVLAATAMKTYMIRPPTDKQLSDN